MASATERPAPTGALERGALRRLDAWAWTALSVTSVIVLFAVLIAFGFGDTSFSETCSNVGLVLAPVLSGAACLHRAVAGRSRVRASWALIGLGALSWGIGQAYWAWESAIAGDETPFPSLADIGYVAMMFFTVVGLLVLPVSTNSVANRARSVLDGLMVAVSLLLIAWMLVVRPLIDAGADGQLALSVSLSYPIGDVVMITIVAYMLAMQRRHGRDLTQLILVGGGTVAFALADIGYAYLCMIDEYTTTSMADVGWFAGFMLILLAARTPKGSGAEHTTAAESDGRPFGVLLPYVAVAAALVTSIVWYSKTGRTDAVVSWSRSALILLIIGRQLLTAVENRDLTRGLETRVEERTAEMHAREQHFHALVQHSTDVVTVVSPQTEVLYQSDSVRRVFGYRARSIAGRRLVDLIDAESAALLDDAMHVVLRAPGSSTVIEVTVRHHDGRPRLAEMTITNLLDDPNVAGVVLNTRDISERRELQDQLVHEAYHDALTGLANRTLFHERARHSLLARRPDDTVTVLFLDLDGFKEVNDSLGHQAGDKLLVQVGTRLRSRMADNAVVARFGGDEFAVLLVAPAATSSAEGVAQRILDGFREPFGIDGRELHVQASIGLASIGPHTPTAAGPHPDDAEQLLRNADLAMYRAKAAGGNGFADYDPQMLAGLVERLEMETDLRVAVELGELRLHYQPIVELADNRIIGFEALVRWQHPRRGLVAPLDFLPLAEATGLIGGIGRWVLTEACQQAMAWSRAHGQPPVTMAVNISVRQFLHGNLAAVLDEVLTETAMPADRLCLEMTESVLIDGTEENLDHLLRLKAVGVTLAIDDFGTGYSSLAYLRRFPIDILKIDRSFVRRLGEQTDDAALADTIIQLGRSLSMATVAEGIEEFGQLAALREMGCELAQGYYFSRPLPADQAGRLLLGAPVAASTPVAG